MAALGCGSFVLSNNVKAKPTEPFQMTHDRMAADQETENKKRAKELDTKYSGDPFGRRRTAPVTVTGARKPLTKATVPAKGHLPSTLDHTNTQSKDSHTVDRDTIDDYKVYNPPEPPCRSRTAHATTSARPLLPPPPKRSKQQLPDIMKLPLRERIIQLLAVRSYKKGELRTRISNEGCKSKDKKNIMKYLTSVSKCKSNVYHLQTNLWGEVKEDWPFYTDEEKHSVNINKAEHVLPNTGMDKAQNVTPNTGRDKEPSSRETSQTSRDSKMSSTKRSYEDTDDLNPTAKKRWRHDTLSEKKRKSNSFKSSHNPSEFQVDGNISANGRNNHSNIHLGNEEELNSKKNCKVSQNIKPLHMANTAPIPPSQNIPQNHKIGFHMPSSGNQSHINGVTNNYHKQDYNDVPDTTAIGSSPNSHMDVEEPDYLTDTYTNIIRYLRA